MKYLLPLLIFFNAFLFANEKVSIQFEWKHQFEFAGYYMAKEKGFYNNFDLDVEFKEFNNGINVVNDVKNGKSDFGITYQTIISSESDGKNITLLHATFQSSPHAMMALESSNINSIYDFKGKTIMADEAWFKAAPVISMLKKHKLNFDDLRFKLNTFTVDPLVNKEVDVMNIYVSNQPYIMKEKGIKYKIFDPKDFGFDFYENLLITSQDYLKKNPLIVKNFNDATIKGWEYAYNNIEETVDVILKKYNTQNKSKEALIFEANELKKLSYYNSNIFGNIDENKIQRIYDVYNLLGMVEKPLKYEEFVFDESDRVYFTLEEQNYLKNKKVLKAHIDTDWRPYAFVENGEARGYLADLQRLVAKKLDLKLELLQNDWDTDFNKLKSNEIDLMFEITKTKERENYFLFSDLAIQSEYYSIVSFDNLNTIEKLKNKRIGVEKGTIHQQNLEKFIPSATIVEYPDTFTYYQDLINGKIDALYEDYTNANFKVNSLNIGKKVYINVLTLDKNINQNHIATNKENSILMTIINKVLTKKDIQKLQEKWGLKVNDDDKTLKLNDEEKEYLSKTKFNLHINEWAPFRIYDKKSKKYSGMSIDYFEKIAESIDLNYDVKHYDTFAERLKNEKNDPKAIAIFSAKTDTNKDYSNFTIPFASYPVALVSKIDKEFITDFKYLEGKKIAVGKNYSAYVLLNQYYPNIDFVFTKNTMESIQLVLDEKVFGAIDLLPIMNYDLNLHSHKSLKISGISQEKLDISISVNNDNKRLIPILNKVIESLPSTTKEEIEKKWLYNSKVEVINYEWLWYIVALLAIFIIVILYTNNKVLKQKQEKEKEQTLLLKNAMKIGKMASWKFDVFSNNLTCSDELKIIFGLNINDNLTLDKQYELIHPDDVLYVKKIYQDVFAHNVPLKVSYRLIVNGETRYFQVIGETQLDKRGNVIKVTGYTQDITEKVSVEQEKEAQQSLLMKQSRHAQMGEMISMIGHQWRQPLNALSIWHSNLFHLLEEEKFEHALLPKVKSEMQKILINLSDTINDFKDFFKPDKETNEFFIKQTVEKTINLISDKIKNSKVEIDINIDEKISHIGYQNELAQVFMVIINNAIEQFDEMKDIEDRSIKITTQQNNENTIIEICDNAGGIALNIIDKIFDPYFSTKSLNGTGIGLYLVKMIIEKSMNGKITVNNFNNGACFTIAIPNVIQDDKIKNETN